MSRLRCHFIILFLMFGNFSSALLPAGETPADSQQKMALSSASAVDTNRLTPSAPHEQTQEEKVLQRRLLVALIGGLLLLGVAYRFARRRNSSARQ